MSHFGVRWVGPTSSRLCTVEHTDVQPSPDYRLMAYLFLGVSSDQQLSPRVQDEEEDDDVEEVVFEEEVYTEPEIKQEIIEVEDEKPEVETLRMDTVNIKREKNQPVVTLSK